MNKSLLSREIGSAELLMSHFLMFVAVSFAFISFNAILPATDLDSSWMLAMNEATVRHMRMGDAIVFSFGPYAFVETLMYHPSLAFVSVAVPGFVALAFFTCLLLLQRRPALVWTAALIVFFTGLVVWRDHSDPALYGAFIGRDAIFFAYYLLLAMVCASAGTTTEGSAPRAPIHRALVAILFLPLAVFPLMKTTFLPMTMLVGAACIGYWFWRRQYLLAIALLCTVIVGMVLFWIGIGQPLDGLFSYVVHVPDVVSNYEEAMQTSGPDVEAGTYLVAATLMVSALLFSRRLAGPERLLLLFVYSLFFFVSFKGGFIRHDIHAMQASSSIFLAALFLPLVVRGRLVVVALAASFVYVLFMDVRYLAINPVRLASSMSENVALEIAGIQTRLVDPHEFDRQYNAKLAAIANAASLPCLTEPTDVYSHGQSIIIASHIPWSPRPTIQSYMTYSEALAELNAEHLHGDHAPVNILFKLEPIDGRYPALEDGASWPALLANYRPVGRTGQYVLLHKTTTQKVQRPTPSRVEPRRLGEWVPLSDFKGPTFVRMDFKRSLMGRALAVLYKAPRLVISVRTDDGKTASYRIPSSMAASGFLISPLVVSTDQFARLYDDASDDAGRHVTSFSVSAYSRAAMWSQDYRVELTQLPTSQPTTGHDLVEMPACHR